MSLDKELFKLCRNVYENTGWFSTKESSWFHYFEPTPAKYHPGEWRTSFKQVNNPKEQYWEHIPLYTIDYLLDKLPTNIGANLTLEADGNKFDKWCAYYDARPVVLKSYYNKSPLIALLKLTIALREAGELKELANGSK